jgi:hypothetical protein
VSVPPLQNPHYVAALETPANKTIAIHLADVSDLIAYGRSIGPVRGLVTLRQTFVCHCHRGLDG